MCSTAIFYGSSKGNTEQVAKQIAEKLNADIFNVANTNPDKLQQYNNLIFGTPTYGEGELQDDWKEFISDVEKADLSGKTIAIFGVGSGIKHGDTFVDGIGIIYNTIKNKNCKIVGFAKTDNYFYKTSIAIVNNKFVGLPLDNKEQPELTDDRIEKWVNQIRGEFKV